MYSGGIPPIVPEYTPGYTRAFPGMHPVISGYASGYIRVCIRLYLGMHPNTRALRRHNILVSEPPGIDILQAINKPSETFARCRCLS